MDVKVVRVLETFRKDSDPMDDCWPIKANTCPYSDPAYTEPSAL